MIDIKSPREIFDVETVQPQDEAGFEVAIVQIESDFFEDHAELNCNHRTTRPARRHAYPDLKETIHATAVASIIGSQRFGMAPRARHIFYGFDAGKAGFDDALLKLGKEVKILGLKPGDIVSISLQVAGLPTDPPRQYMPVDARKDNASSIRSLVEKHNLIVVIAAGNSKLNLDTQAMGVFSSNGPDYISLADESKALRVGYTNHAMSELANSNYGTRVEMFAPAESVRAACYDYHEPEGGGDLLDTFVGGFRRTSAAAPMVAGALARIQSEYKKVNPGHFLNRDQMLELVRASGIRSGIEVTRFPAVKPDIAAAVKLIRDGWVPI